MACLFGCLMSSASIQKLFCGIYSVFKCSFNEFVGEKVVTPSYSSTILGLPPWMPFIYFNCLSAVARASSTVWNTKDILALFLISEESLQSLTILMLSVRFLDIPYQGEKCPSIASLLSTFVIEMRFFWIYWDDHVYFLYSFGTRYYINWYSCVESLLQTWNKSHLITVYNTFYKVQDSIANILLIFFASKHEKYQFIIFLCHFIWFLLLR